jgi:quercetin dioxygenase-like cupin family protein
VTVFMPSDMPMLDVSPGVRAHRVVDQSQGSGAVTVGELEIEPGASLALHRHKVEEVVIIVSGQARFTLDGEASDVSHGAILHAPAGQPHSLECISPEPLRIYFVFPAVNVEREWA